MKRTIFITLLALFSLVAFSQRVATIDNLEGAETNLSTVMQDAKVITATCANVGGTSDGTLTLYGSVDGTSYVFINYLGGELGVASPKASITGADLNQVTITDGLIASWTIKGDFYNYFKVSGGGTSGDTTSVTIAWTK